MALNLLNYKFFWLACRKIGIKSSKDIKNKWMLELGNQRIRKEVKEFLKINFYTAKEYFASLGCIHYSLDLNGLDGTIPIDLGKQCNLDFWENKFDIITNFGMIEHISNNNQYKQWQAWENIHNLAKKGAIFIHSLPQKKIFP